MYPRRHGRVVRKKGRKKSKPKKRKAKAKKRKARTPAPAPVVRPARRRRRYASVPKRPPTEAMLRYNPYHMLKSDAAAAPGPELDHPEGPALLAVRPLGRAAQAHAAFGAADARTPDAPGASARATTARRRVSWGVTNKNNAIPCAPFAPIAHNIHRARARAP